MTGSKQEDFLVEEVSPEKLHFCYCLCLFLCLMASFALVLSSCLLLPLSLSEPSRSQALPNPHDPQWAPGPQSPTGWTSGPHWGCSIRPPPLAAARPYANGLGLPQEQCHVTGEGELRPALPGESSWGALVGYSLLGVCGGTLRSVCQSSLRLVPRLRAPDCPARNRQGPCLLHSWVPRDRAGPGNKE